MENNRVYAVLYSEDAFLGVSVPANLKFVLEDIGREYGEEVITEIIDDYKEYRDTEVFLASHAKDGSGGTEELETEKEIRDYIIPIN